MAIGSKRPWAILWARKGRTPARGVASLVTKANDALAKAKRHEKYSWEFRWGVSQKPSHLTTWVGWKTRPPREIGAREEGGSLWLGVRQLMSSVWGMENSTSRVRPLRARVRKIPCRRRMLVLCNSEASVTEKSYMYETISPFGMWIWRGAT